MSNPLLKNNVILSQQHATLDSYIAKLVIVSIITVAIMQNFMREILINSDSLCTVAN